MSEDLGEQVQSAFRGIYEAVDRKYLRPLKRDMFRCGIDCLDDQKPIKEAERCIDDCSLLLHKAMNLVQRDVNAFQGRIDRCLVDCQDSVRGEKNEDRARTKFNTCAESCIKKFIPTTPDVIRALSKDLDELRKTNG